MVKALKDLARGHLLPLLVLVSFCLYLFREILIGGHLLAGTDFVAFYMGMKQFLYDEIHRHHSIPFWNPYLFGGIPFWAHFESAIFYPLGLLFWFLPAVKAYGLTAFLHLVLAGSCMYALARSFGLSRAAGFISGVAYTCNGFIMAILFLGHLSPVQSYGWLPLVIYLLRRTLISNSILPGAALAGCIWGVQILAGAPQDAFYTFLAAASFLLFFLEGGVLSGAYWSRFGGAVSLLFIFGIGLAAIQLVPAFEFIGESVRAALDNYAMVTERSYPPQGLVTTLMPHFFGNFARDDFWVSGVPFTVPQRNLYVGLLPLFLILFLSYRREDQRRLLLFAGLMALTALVLALGKYTPVYKLAYLFPGFDRFRAPSKILVLWMFALSLLAGKGMDDLLHAREVPCRGRSIFLVVALLSLVVLDAAFHLDKGLVLKFFAPFIPEAAIPSRMGDAAAVIGAEFHRLTLISLCVALILGLWFSGRLRPALLAGILGLAAMMDLAYVNGGAVRPRDEIYRAVEGIQQRLDATLGKDKEVFRVGSFRTYLGPNIEMALGYQTVGGFTALFPHRYYAYINRYSEGLLPEGWVYFFYGRHKDKVLMDLLNVKYEVSHDQGSFTRRPSCLPRAFMVPNAEILEQGSALDALTRPDFDPTVTVFFEREEAPAELQGRSPPGQAKEGRARITGYRPDHIALEIECRQPGFLFLGEVFYPGWRAFVDQREVRILRGNYLFRVIEIPAGRHQVRLIFEPLTIKIGTGISIFTLFMLLNLLLYGRLKSGRPGDRIRKGRTERGNTPPGNRT